VFSLGERRKEGLVATTIIERARGMFAREQPGSTGPAKPAGPLKKPVQTYHAVSVEPGRNCCHSARVLKGQRFLSREAPQLPLKNCANAECTCYYTHHDDRRGGPRRARDMGVSIDGWIETDRRDGSPRGRRKSDKIS
jgi:hypothetical protein